MSETSRWRSRALSLAALALGAACGLRVAPSTLRRTPRVWERSSEGEGPSRAIYPTQRIPLRFDHRQHLAIGGVTCVRCHADAARSESVADRLLPSEAVCASCHAIDRAQPDHAATPSARCESCHVGFDRARPTVVARVEIPPANLRFSHDRHARAGVGCESCHGGVRRGALATRFDLPTMRECVRCHEARGASTRCASCHLTEPDGVLRTRFEEGWLNPPSWMGGLRHDPDFWLSHRTVAATGDERCASCHRERECVECHDGRLRDRRTHPNDYLTFHGTEARMAAERCTSCHRAQSFCDGCHRRAGVSLSSAPASRISGRFHSSFEEWAGPVVTTNHHAMEARRNLTACVSCHTERDCVSCHSTAAMGGAGANPHPPGFAGTCGALLRASERGCAQCHRDVAGLAARCE
jgi:hypothetical protein